MSITAREYPQEVPLAGTDGCLPIKPLPGVTYMCSRPFRLSTLWPHLYASPPECA